MKKGIAFVIVCVELLCTSCVALPSHSRVEELYAQIPNHVMTEKCSSFMSEELYGALVEAYDIPSDASCGGIGSEEFLFYFVSGNGDCTSTKLSVGMVHRVSNTVATATIRTSCNDETTEHILTMTLHDGIWLLSDFDGQLAVLKTYIQTQRGLMKTAQVITEIQACEQLTDEEKAEQIEAYKNSVEAYFEKYPPQR